MSELQYYLRPRPAYEPIRTRGNAFWRGSERFFIKGIHYFRRNQPEDPGIHRQSNIDCLTNNYIPALKRDIQLFCELGLNTISVSGLDPSQNHHEALSLLAQAGIYVLVTLDQEFATPDFSIPDYNPNFPTQPLYSPYQTLKLIDQLTPYPNILAFILPTHPSLNLPRTTKTAELLRATIRDLKSYLSLTPHRQIPIGISHPELLVLRQQILKYFTSSPRGSRIDFFAPDIWGWAYKSSFRISGWENQSSMLSDISPLPMFLNGYGAYVRRRRIWQEVPCLYSPDMTGVFSGGCAYGFYEYRAGYGVVRLDGRRKREFAPLREKFEEVNRRSEEEVWDRAVLVNKEDYEDWDGAFPEVGDDEKWYATPNLPEFPMEWDVFIARIRESNEKALEEDGWQSSRIGALSLARS